MKLIKLNKPTITALRESDRVDDFLAKSRKRFFATISGYVDKSFFTDSAGVYDEKAHHRYNERNTNSLLSNLKRLGLDYQKVTGIWKRVEEKSFLVWNTAYSWEQFQQVMLKLNKLFKQEGICIGREVDGKYKIDLWETEDMNEIMYEVTSTFTTVSVSDALKDFGTVLTRKIHDKNGKIDPNKVKDSIKFEALQENHNAASRRTVMGEYARSARIDSLFGRNPHMPVTDWGPHYTIQDALRECNHLDN